MDFILRSTRLKYKSEKYYFVLLYYCCYASTLQKYTFNNAKQTYRIFLGQVFRLKLFLLYKDALFIQRTVSTRILRNLAFRMLLDFCILTSTDFVPMFLWSL